MRYVPLGVLLILVSSSSALYHLCVLRRTNSYSSSEEICQKLQTTMFRCIVGQDRLDCMKKISSGDADLAVFEAEDILIAADDSHLSDILITHKIHASEDKKWEFAVVALISDKVKVSKLSDLKGKRLCHPGNNPHSSIYDWSEVFSLYFENRVVPQICEKDISVEENRVKALSSFFGESCKPGVWAADPDVDIELKRKYKSLCGLCDVPSVCSQRDKYWGRQGALYCLSDCLGDVAWSMLKDAKLHFSNKGISVCSDVSLLCPNGTTIPINSSEPCVWVTRPVPVIAAKRSKAEAVQQMIRETLLMPDIPDDFIKLLEAHTFLPPLQITPTITPNDFLASAPGFLSANSMSICGQRNRTVKLCVGALQDKIKCEWLAAISKVYGVQPAISCVYGANCMVSVANRSSDATIINTDDLLPAVRDHDLKVSLVQMPVQFKKAKTISAVVRTTSKINKILDLKGKKGCFPSIDGMGWTSFILHMQRTVSLVNSCPYTKVVSEFFSEICVSEPSPEVSAYKNIKLCSGEYGDNWSDQHVAYNNEALAFQCLAIGGGDVAFIQSDLITKYLEDMKNNPAVDGLSTDSFKVICDGSSDTACDLGWSSYSQVVVRNTISPSKEEDVRSFFTGISNLFATTNSPSTRTYNLFSYTNTLFDTVDLPDTLAVNTQRLEQIEDFYNKAVKRPSNYETNIKSVLHCSPSRASQQPYVMSIILLLFTVLSFIMK